MVSKVIDDRDSIDYSTNLKPAFHALESRQSLDNGLRWHALPSGKSSRCSSIQCIVLASHWQAQLGEKIAATSQSPVRKRAFMLKSRNTPIRVDRKTIPFNRTKSLRHALTHVLATIQSNNASTPRNK